MQNLVRGRGLLCRSLMKSQMASPTFTPIFAALVSVINTKFPEIGELLLHRLILQASSPAPPLPLFCQRLQQQIGCRFRAKMDQHHVPLYYEQSLTDMTSTFGTRSLQGILTGCVPALQFKRAFKRNDKPICLAVSLFIAHLVNQQVADDMLSIETAILLLDNPSGRLFSTFCVR